STMVMAVRIQCRRCSDTRRAGRGMRDAHGVELAFGRLRKVDRRTQGLFGLAIAKCGLAVCRSFPGFRLVFGPHSVTAGAAPQQMPARSECFAHTSCLCRSLCPLPLIGIELVRGTGRRLGEIRTLQLAA